MNEIKVLVSDNLDTSGIEILAAAEGITVDVKTGHAPEALNAMIGDYDGLIIRSATKVDAVLLAAARRLKVVGRAGIGLDNVDIAAATRRGIVVMNTPDGNVVTTAEHAVAMMLALTRNIPRGTASLKEGRWEKKQLQGRELFNKFAGVIGFGKIGSIVADRLRGLKMQVLVHDPFVRPEQIEKAGFQPVTFDDLLARADYVTVHVPKLKETIGLIDASALARMKDAVMIVNCARGGIVDEDALLAALNSGKVAGAALDVFATEPPGASDLVVHPNVICTPHLGAATKEAQTNVAVAVARQFIEFFYSGTIINAVNAPAVAGDLLAKLGPLLSMGEQIGRLQAQLIDGPIIEVAIEYAGDFRGLDPAPVTTAVLKGLLTRELKDDVNYINAPVLAKGRGIRVTETTSNESEDYLNLVRVKVDTTTTHSAVAGTVFGKRDSRIVRINNFRLEMIPEGHLALIYNIDKPGSIGQIGSTLGRHKINIGRMQVGQEEGGDRNIIFLTTDTPIPPEVIEEINGLSLVKSAIALEF